jgi:MoxR-like ATPase
MSQRDEPPLAPERAADICTDILDAVSESVIASDAFLENVLTGIVARGHVLLEDVPGTGKTLTARTFAEALGAEFSRVQFTPDLLPSDITGSTIYLENTAEFEFNEGPVFANIVLADEINRAPPKTQAALLEAMEERQISERGTSYDLPTPFFVIATQNPIEQEGTFRLPEAQRDRFMIKTAIGYPEEAAEAELLDRRLTRLESSPTTQSVASLDEFTSVQQCAEYVDVDPAVRDYLLAIGRATRNHEQVDVGVSPRGIQQHLEAARARAVINGRGYVVPSDIKTLAAPALAHRVVLTSTASVEDIRRGDVITEVLSRIDVPTVDFS